MSKQKFKNSASVDDAALNLIIVLIVACIVLVLITGVYLAITKAAYIGSVFNSIKLPGADDEATYPFRENITVTAPDYEKGDTLKDEINSDYAILVDVTDGVVVATKLAGTSIHPASMTKVMTLIVVVENLKNEASLDEVLTIADKDYGENSGYGLEVGEKLTVRDLLYASILQSDGRACLILADYIAGSEAKFVQMMNEKATEMGLSKATYFQNCTGLTDTYHRSTCRDIAMIMEYAMENPLCADVLTRLVYEPSDNFRPGEGMKFWHKLMHNLLSDGSKQPSTAEILGGKTGLTESTTSGYCVVSYAKGDNGHYYVCVTAKADSFTANVEDMLYIYNNYAE